MIIARLGLAVGVAFLAALAAYPAMKLGRRPRAATLLAAAVPIGLSPLLVPAEAPLGRLFAAMNAIAILLKLYDLHLSSDWHMRPDFRRFIAFLPNWLSLVYRKLDDEPRPPASEDGRRLVFGAAGLAAGGSFFAAMFLIDWRGRPFAVEHAAKAFSLYATIVPGAAAAAAAWRLAGGRARDPMDRPILARTPADFWRRYNRPVNQFFYENLFKPAGGLRFPVRTTLLTFALSALIHEYVFGIAIGRVQGYQTAFFLLQGAATAATLRVRPTGPAAVPWIAATVAFNFASTVLFFASLDGIVSFYVNPLPDCLRNW